MGKNKKRQTRVQKRQYKTSDKKLAKDALKALEAIAIAKANSELEASPVENKDKYKDNVVETAWAPRANIKIVWCHECLYGQNSRETVKNGAVCTACGHQTCAICEHFGEAETILM